MYEKWLLETMLYNFGCNNDMSKDSDRDNSGKSNKDDKEVLVDVPFIDFNASADEEIEQSRDKIMRYVELQKSVIRMDDEGDNEVGEVEKPTNIGKGFTENTVNIGRACTTEFGKVTSYDSEYKNSLDLRSYEDTSEESSVYDARWPRSKKNYYDPNVQLTDIFLGLEFQNLKLFKGELVEFLTTEGFEFSYNKNVVSVWAKCSNKGLQMVDIVFMMQ